MRLGRRRIKKCLNPVYGHFTIELEAGVRLLGLVDTASLRRSDRPFRNLPFSITSHYRQVHEPVRGSFDVFFRRLNHEIG